MWGIAMHYRNETEMYPDVINWLGGILRTRFRGSEIDIRDTHSLLLNKYIRSHGLLQYFQGNIWQTYDIRVDVTAFIKSQKSNGLVFVECKTTNISLLNVSQLLGYSRVALPLSSYLVSSAGIGTSVQSLITKYGRSDILEYYWGKGEVPRKMIVAKWDSNLKSIDPNSVLPPGASGQL